MNVADPHEPSSDLQADETVSTTPPRSRYRFPQTRAIEVRLPDYFETSDASRLVWKVHQSGFNTLLINCFSHGYTVHPSEIMRGYKFPPQNPTFRGGDPALALLRAARRIGLAVYALVDCLKVGDYARSRSPILRRRPEWGIRGRAGADRRPEREYLCPVNRHVWRFLGDLFHEMLELYGFRGLYMRHLQYPLVTGEGPEADFCRCTSCRRAVWHSLGVRIEKIPDDPDHPDRYNITAWRAQQLEDLVRYLRLRTAKACVEARAIAEVLLDDEDTPLDALGYQDARSWSEERLVPIMAVKPPPDRQEDSEDWIETVSEFADSVLTMPVLSARSDSPLIDVLQTFRTQPISGIAVAEPHDLTAPPLNQLAWSVWRHNTRVAEDQPSISICALLAASIPLLETDNPVRAFLEDVLRLLEPIPTPWPSAQRQTLHENLVGLEERIEDGRLDLGDAGDLVLRNFRLARRLLGLMELES